MRLLVLTITILSLAGCKSAYYGTMAKFGVHKRDILVDRVEEAREEQADAQEQFESTYDAFQALTGFSGGDLEELYDDLKSEYEDSSEAAEAVAKRIDKIETVAQDLFAEWSDEIEEINDSELRRQSRELLRDTESDYESLIRTMRRAEESMAPVLQKFGDHVLFLKHNLNAQAISSLENNALEIGDDVRALVDRMEASIAEADAFIARMRTEG